VIQVYRFCFWKWDWSKNIF